MRPLSTSRYLSPPSRLVSRTLINIANASAVSSRSALERSQARVALLEAENAALSDASNEGCTQVGAGRAGVDVAGVLVGLASGAAAMGIVSLMGARRARRGRRSE